MINLKFNSLKLEGFQSLGKVEIDFKNLGTCFIKGINKYDGKTKSNGSGKSSLMSSISWCLFGKTPSGISNDVVNKFLNNGCFVELNLDVDNVNYVIRRSVKHKEYKTNLVILKDSDDISGRNKTDSDDLIKDILKIDNEIFSQMIFLSQGFANRFAIYTPKARKELLESLYNIDERLETFISDLKIKESVIKNDIDDKTKKNLELNTKIQMLENVISANNTNIMFTENKIAELMSTKSNISAVDISNLQSQYDELVDQVEKINEKYLNQQSITNDMSRQINELLDLKRKYENEIVGFSNNKMCPTCGTMLEDYENNEHIQKHILELKVEIENIDTRILELQTLYQKNNDICSKMNSKLASIKINRDNIKVKLVAMNSEYQQELQKDTRIGSYQDKLLEYTKNINDATEEINAYTDEVRLLTITKDKKEKELEIMQHSIRLANNQFKSYLLENIVTSLNDKLQELSVSLFENEIIKIDGDNKLNILIGDKTYEQCSGGEQRRADVAIIIAQRFLAQQMNAVSSNILILDEVFDGLDDVSFGIVLELLSDEMQDIESMFIISHRDVKEIPLDNMILITKNKNQISEVQFS